MLKDKLRIFGYPKSKSSPGVIHSTWITLDFEGDMTDYSCSCYHGVTSAQKPRDQRKPCYHVKNLLNKFKELKKTWILK